MQSLTLSFILLLVPMLSFASQPEISYECASPKKSTKISSGAGDGNILKIKSLEIPSVQNPKDFKVKMVVDGVTTIDAANGDSNAKESVEIFKLKESKSGTMFELSGDSNNTFDFDAVFLEFGDVDAQTAGPIPPGTYATKISMAFVDSNTYYKNASVMTVKKFAFDCTTTIKY